MNPGDLVRYVRKGYYYVCTELYERHPEPGSQTPAKVNSRVGWFGDDEVGLILEAKNVWKETWCKVQVNDCVGWVNGKHLEAIR